MVADRILTALKLRSAQTLAGNGYKPAAVLIPIQERSDGDYLVLTKRADHLSTHKGQIAFPGGRVDRADGALAAALGRLDEAAKVTAIRETIEETGVIPAVNGPIDPAILRTRR